MDSNKTIKIKKSTVGAYIQCSKNIHINNIIINKLADKENFQLPPVINTFTGREKEFSLLESLFFNVDYNKIKKKVVLCGIPGIGKSELAKQFANKCEKDGKVSAVYWISADSEQKLKKFFASIKAKHIEAGKQKYLFVLDNAISRNSLGNCELSDDHLFLITSQKKDWGIHIQTLELNPLTGEYAINFYEMKLKTDYKEEDKHLYMKIANFVGCIPLGLQITGAYIQEAKKIHGEEFLQKYIETLKQSENEVVEQYFPPSADNPYQKSIYGAIKISIDKISTDTDIKFPYLALSTLYVCCYLDPDFINLKLLLKLSNIDKILKTENCNINTLKQSLILLDNFSLINFIARGSHIKIHRFTQKILRFHLAKYDSKIQFNCYTSCLDVIFKFKKYYPYGESSDDEDEYVEEDEYSDDEDNSNKHEMTEAEKEYLKFFGYDVDTEYEYESDEDDAETGQYLVDSNEKTRDEQEISDTDLFGNTELDVNTNDDPNDDNDGNDVHDKGELDLINSNVNTTNNHGTNDYDLFGDTEYDQTKSNNKPVDSFWSMAYDFITPKILQHADTNLDAFSNFYATNKHILLNDSSEDSILVKILEGLVENGCIKCVQLLYSDFDETTKKYVAGFNLSYRAYSSRQFDILKLLLNFDDEATREHGRLLNDAASKADFKMVKVILEHNSELIHASWLGNTPIFEYFQGIYEYHHDYSNIKDVLDLLKCKANKDMRNSDGCTVLHASIGLFSEDIIETLITEYDMDVNAQNKNGNTPLHSFIYASLCSTIDTQTLNKITKLFLIYGASLSVKNKSGLTALEYAEAFGNYCSAGYIRSIILYFSDCTKDFTNALHRAVFRNNLEKVILEDIDVNCLDEDLDTAMHLAATEWNLEAMKVLLNHKADFNIRNKKGNTALFNLFLGARYFKYIDLEKIRQILSLLEFQKHVYDVNNSKETLLHIAAVSIHEKLVTLLVENYNFDVNIQDSKGNTPLHTLIIELAKRKPDENEKVRNAIMKLKKYGASLDVVDNTGMTVIELAQYYKLDYTLIVLLFDDKNIDRLTILTEDHIKTYVEKYFLLHYCTKYNQIGTLILLLNLNIDVNILTEKHNSALHVACLTGNLNAIKILVDYNADLSLKNKNGDIPLFCFAKSASEHKHLNLIEIEQILDVLQCTEYKDFTDSSGKTLLHIAVILLHADLVELLLTKYNFDANKTDLRNKSALHDLIDRFPDTHYLYPPDITNMRRIAETLKQNGAFLDTALDENGLYSTITYIVLFDDEDTIIDKLSKLFQKLGKDSSEYISKLGLIHYAIAANYIKLLNNLIEQDVWNIVQTSCSNTCPLHVAAFYWNFRATRILMHCNAKLDVEDIDGDTPLFTFFKGGLEQNKVNLERVNKILNLLKIQDHHNTTNKSKETLLHIAATSFRADLIELLINNYEVNIDSQDFKGRTPLHAFVLKLATENINTTKRWMRICNTAVTLKLNGASLDIQDENGLTPIELAHMFKVSYILIYLLFDDKYADDLRNIFKKLDEETKKTIFKVNILENALWTNQLDVLDVLLENNRDVDCKYDNENTLLHFAAYNWNSKAIHILVKHGAALNVENDIGKSPLHEFLEAPRFYDVNMDNMYEILSLLKCKENKSDEKWTVLHSAAMSLNADLVDVLLNEYKFNVNLLDERKNTPLHIFIRSLTKPHDKKLEDVIQTLEILLNGASLDLKNDEGLTPFEFALKEKLDYLLPYLITIENEPETEIVAPQITFTSIFNIFVAFCCVFFYLYFTYFLLVILL